MDVKKAFGFALLALWIYLAHGFYQKFGDATRYVGGSLGFRLHVTWSALATTTWYSLFWLAVTGTIAYLLWRR